MKKSSFVTLLLAVAAGLLIAIGMCMALLPEWNAFVPGIVVGCVGLALLLVLLLVRRKLKGLPPIRLIGRAVATAALAVVGALVLGAGMCMVMVWEMLIPGMVVGIIGILLLLCLIPMIKGLS